MSSFLEMDVRELLIFHYEIKSLAQKRETFFLLAQALVVELVAIDTVDWQR